MKNMNMKSIDEQIVNGSSAYESTGDIGDAGICSDGGRTRIFLPGGGLVLEWIEYGWWWAQEIIQNIQLGRSSNPGADRCAFVLRSRAGELPNF